MTDLLREAHLWIKALHVVSVIVWMGVQLVLPLLLAAHRALPSESVHAQMLAAFERRLIRWVMNPAIVAAFVLGGLMVYTIVATSGGLPGWLQAKLVLVVALSALHGGLARESRRLAQGAPGWRHATYRRMSLLNLGMLTLVAVLVIIKPAL